LKYFTFNLNLKGAVLEKLEKILSIVSSILTIIFFIVFFAAVVAHHHDDGRSYCIKHGHYVSDSSLTNIDDKKAGAIATDPGDEIKADNGGFSGVALKPERIGIGSEKLSFVSTKAETNLNHSHILYADFKDRPGW
jgi:hypothetical protein